MTINVHDVKKGTSVKLSPDRKNYVVEKVGTTYNTINGRKRTRIVSPIKRIKRHETEVYLEKVTDKLKSLGYDLPVGISVSTKYVKGLLCVCFVVSAMAERKTSRAKQMYIGTKNTWESRIEKVYKEACDIRQAYYEIKHNNLQQKLASRQ